MIFFSVIGQFHCEIIIVNRCNSSVLCSNEWSWKWDQSHHSTCFKYLENTREFENTEYVKTWQKEK